ncbi:MAG: MarR family transcriptional regulator [Paludibacteraceae bacterium]|nr:MarR family transcriptional regulator [Paludibacteraceae bacterium]
MYDQLKLENQLCFRLYTAARLTMQAYFPYFEPLGITYPQYLVLLVLWEKDHQPVNDIAHRLHLETNTVTPLLQRMEKQGLLTRTRGKEDTRQRIVSLTKQGKALEEQAKSIPDCLSSQLTDKNVDIETLLTAIPVLDSLIEGLSKNNK